MVIWIDIYTKRRFSAENLNVRLKDVGEKTFEYKGKKHRKGKIKWVWEWRPQGEYRGRIEFGEDPEEKLIYVSAWGGGAEERLAGSFIEWVLRHFKKDVKLIEVTAK